MSTQSLTQPWKEGKDSKAGIEALRKMEEAMRLHKSMSEEDGLEQTLNVIANTSGSNNPPQSLPAQHTVVKATLARRDDETLERSKPTFTAKTPFKQ